MTFLTEFPVADKQGNLFNAEIFKVRPQLSDVFQMTMEVNGHRVNMKKLTGETWYSTETAQDCLIWLQDQIGA